MDIFNSKLGGLSWNQILLIKDAKLLKNIISSGLLLENLKLEPISLKPITLKANENTILENSTPEVTSQLAQNNIVGSLKAHSFDLKSSETLNHMMEVTELFSLPSFKKETLSLLLKINHELPDLLLPVLDFIEHLPESQKEALFPEALKFLNKITTNLNEEILKIPPEKVAFKALGLKQELIQNLRQLKSIFYQLESRPNENSAKEVLNYLLQNSTEPTLPITEELFALSTLLKNGFSLEEYTLSTHHENPLKTALILIEASKLDAAKPEMRILDKLVTQLKLNLLDEEAFQKTLTQFVETQKVSFPQKSGLDIQNSRPLREGLFEFLPQNKSSDKILIQALSQDDGIIPSAQLSIQSSALQTSIQGSLLLARNLAPGFNTLKIEAKSKAKNLKSTFSIFSLLGAQFLSEEVDEKQNSSSANSWQIEKYQFDTIKGQTPSILLGALSFSLNAPVFLTENFSDKKAPSPQHFEYYFLNDFIKPSNKFDRKKFLSLSESLESIELRKCIAQLNEKGMAAFEAYQAALKNFLKSIQTNFPEAKASIDKAEAFLTSQVKKYLEHKEDNTFKNQLLESMPGGNLMASVLQQTAILCEKQKKYGEALIHFAEACKSNSASEDSIGKLENLLQNLRTQFIEKKHYASKQWMQKSQLAKNFLEYYQMNK